MDVDGDNGWKECFSVSGVKLPTGYYFGASAATGQLAGKYEPRHKKTCFLHMGKQRRRSAVLKPCSR